MKKGIITVLVAAALLTVTASTAAADPLPSGCCRSTPASGILVRHDDGYFITGTALDGDSVLAGSVHGTLIEETTGFNSCPDFQFNCFFWPVAGPSPTCNLLGGEVTFNFRGERFDNPTVGIDIDLGRSTSALCRDPNDPTTYRLQVFSWSPNPGHYPYILDVSGTAQEISPTVLKWSGSFFQAN